MLSIIVPTMNRSPFVVRLLEYYARLGYTYPIYIGDSSDRPGEREAIEAAIQRLKGKVNAEYVFCPEMNNYEVMQHIAEKVSTPYAAYLADDDFLVPEAIDQCIAFMDKNPDYFGALGSAVLFRLNNSGPYGAFEASSFYPEFGIEEETADQRLLKHLSNYTSSFHAVCRTDMMRKALRQMNALKQKIRLIDPNSRSDLNFGELLLSCSLVAQGKLKKLDVLHYIRQVHESRYIFSDWFDWISSPTWHVGMRVLQEQLLEDLQEKGVAKEQAQTAVKNGLCFYVATGGISRLKKNALNKNRKEKIKNKLRQIPQVKAIWRFLKALKDEYALESMLKSSSHLHKNFMTVYPLISNTKEAGL